MVNTTQQIMILGNRETQILLLPDQIDLCKDRMAHIANLKVKYYALSTTKKNK